MGTSKKYIGLLAAMLLLRSMAFAQIPVEILAGDNKAVLDIMFFKYFKNKSKSNSKFLFFNRNRASVDYKMTSSTNLPQFGFTEAISYNHEKLLGFAPVIVGQILGSGFHTKAGIQFAKIRKEMTLFAWLVSETKRQPTLDLFFLGRYTPKISDKINLFSQLELVNAIPSNNQKSFSFTQRIRLGLKISELQFGLASDFSEIGRINFTSTSNIGAFIRYEY